MEGVRLQPATSAHQLPTHLPWAAHAHCLPCCCSKWAMWCWPLTLAQPLCVLLHTRAAGHLGAMGRVVMSSAVP
jgi:hypothetical protein